MTLPQSLKQWSHIQRSDEKHWFVFRWAIRGHTSPQCPQWPSHIIIFNLKAKLVDMSQFIRLSSNTYFYESCLVNNQIVDGIMIRHITNATGWQPDIVVERAESGAEIGDNRSQLGAGSQLKIIWQENPLRLHSSVVWDAFIWGGGGGGCETVTPSPSDR